MKIKWQLFAGGRIMFWVALFTIFLCIFAFIFTYFIDPLSKFYMKVQDIDASSIQKISEDYVTNLGIEIDKPIVYRFVRYRFDKGYEAEEGETILLGTFHVWNNTYYIDISVDLYKTPELEHTVIHETRHMIVEYLRIKKIINLNKYTEEIAQHKSNCYNNLFNSSVELLKTQQEQENEV